VFDVQGLRSSFGEGGCQEGQARGIEACQQMSKHKTWCLRCDKRLGARLDYTDWGGRALFVISDPKTCRCLYPIASNKRQHHKEAKRAEYDRIIESVVR
jgi:hypothetical protein